VHAGEAYGAISIDQAIYFLRANRIGHGTSLQEDVKLYNYINNHRIALEMCISSNMHTGAISSLATHPIRRYLNDGLRVCINTDNRLVSNTTVTNELYLLVKHLGFTKGAIKKMLINGVKAGFMPMKCKSGVVPTFKS
jgi:adenosine deaminase